MSLDDMRDYVVLISRTLEEHQDTLRALNTKINNLTIDIDNILQFNKQLLDILDNDKPKTELA